MQFSVLKLFLMLENRVSVAAELGMGRCCGVVVWRGRLKTEAFVDVAARGCIFGSRFLENRMDRFF